MCFGCFELFWLFRVGEVVFFLLVYVVVVVSKKVWVVVDGIKWF